jgi:hypothetical protein
VTTGVWDEPFVGYTFAGSPPRKPRLWFLDRHIAMLMHIEGWTVSGSGTWGDPDPVDIDVGTWSAVESRSGARDEKALEGVCLRYDHHCVPPWSAVWRLTDDTCEHVHTFGRDDDVWRLGVWPD